jgi:hypothetical protein
MMKKLLVVILIAFLSIPVFSQLKFGLKAGVSTTSITMSKAVQLTGQSANYTVKALSSSAYGFHGGLFMRLTILGIYIQPEVLFATAENKYTVTNLTTTTATEVSQKLNNLSIPVMVGVKLGPIRINAGPAGTMAITSPKALINDPALKAIYNKMSIGYQAGLGLDILKKLTIDIRYEGSLQKYQTQIQQSVGKVALDNRPNAFLFSLGLMF